MMVSFCAVLFPRGVLDEILNLIKSVSEGFPSYSCRHYWSCDLDGLNIFLFPLALKATYEIWLQLA